MSEPGHSSARLRQTSPGPAARAAPVPVLRRYSPGQPLLDGPALVWRGRPPAGRRARARAAERASRSHDDPTPRQRSPRSSSTLTGVRDARPTSPAAREVLAPAVRRLGPSGRVVVLGRARRRDAGAAAPPQALDGLVRSVGKEVRAGATANLLVVRRRRRAASTSTLRFFLSARSAFVDGQVVSAVGPAQARSAGRPTGQRPLAGRVAVVTGAARGIGAAIADDARPRRRHRHRRRRPGGRRGAGAAWPTASAAPRCSSTSPPTDAGRAAARARRAAPRRARHRRAQRRHHPRQAAGQHGRRPLGRRCSPSTCGRSSRSTRRCSPPSCSARRGRIVCVVVDERDRRQPRPDQLRGVQGRRHRDGPGARPAARRAGATINAVAPGFIETEMTARMPLGTREAGRRINSLRQGGLPVDVAETSAGSRRPSSGGVTGQVVRVCGQSILGA